MSSILMDLGSKNILEKKMSVLNKYSLSFLLVPKQSCIMAVTKHSICIALGIISNIEMAQSTRKGAW